MPSSSLPIGLTVAISVAEATTGGVAKPNILYFLTDDQDQAQGSSFPLQDFGKDEYKGATPMPQTHEHFQQKGATALNMYIHTPVCNPSRSELLSGRYLHNIVNPKAARGNMGANTTFAALNNFAGLLREQAGYTTGFFGKYVNAWPDVHRHGVNPGIGWDAYLENACYTATNFQVHGLKDIYPDSNMPQDGTWHTANEYCTSFQGNVSAKWITHVVQQPNPKPFLAYVSPHAPHYPYTPAPWYVDYMGSNWPPGPPRRANYNTTKEQRQYHFDYIATNGQYNAEDEQTMREHFLNRWRTLLSVDDLIGHHIHMLEDLGIDNSTYVLYTSDHGYSQGELQLPIEKHNHYDFNTKIHLLVRGPGVKQGSTFTQPATQVDLAPTFLGLAGLDKAEFHDGKSLVPFFVTDTDDASVPASVKQHLSSLSPDYAANWRKSIYSMFFYYEDCGPDPQRGDICADVYYFWRDGQIMSRKDNFISMHYFDDAGAVSGLKYTELYDGDIVLDNVSFDYDKLYWTEIMNMTADPYELENLAPDHHSEANQPVSPQVFEQLKQDLRKWYGCSGDQCP